MRETSFRIALWLLLGGWIGSWACFGLLVAPTAFRVLPTTHEAGLLIGPVLTALHYWGAFAGLGLAVLAHRMHRPALLVWLPLVLAAVCLYSQLQLSPEIAALRPLAYGPDGTLDAAARFSRLHRLSMGLFMVVSAAILVLLGLHARADARQLGRPGANS